MFNEIKTHEITVDIVILTIKDDALQVLLVKRNNEPFKDKWAQVITLETGCLKGSPNV